MSLSVIYYDIPTCTWDYLRAFSKGTQYFANPFYPLGENKGKPYATLEEGGWPLDGRAVLMKDQMPGYWWSASCSDAQGILGRAAELELQISEPITTTGLTFTFWPENNQWCSRIKVSWYRKNALLRQKEFYPDGVRWILQQTVEAFDQIRIEFLQTNRPGQYAKLEKLELGQVWRFEDKDLIHAELNNRADPALSQLQSDTMQVKVRVPADAVLRPKENQRLMLCRGNEPIASHYITGSCRHSKDVYTLQAKSGMGFMDDNYMGGMYNNVRIDLVLDHIFGDWPYQLDSRLQEIKIYGYLPAGTRREALRQVLLAACADIRENAEGVFQVFPAVQAVESAFLESDIFLGAKVTNRRRYSKVEVAVHSYVPGEKIKILLEEEPVYGEQLFWFDRPHHNYSVTGGLLMDSGENYVWIKADGPVTLQGQEYVHTYQLYSKSDPSAVDADGANVLQIMDATLVTEWNVEAFLKQQLRVARLWQTLEMDAVIKTQAAGQKTTAVTPWNTIAQGYITKMKSRLTSQGQVASVTMMVMEQDDQITCRYSGEIYSGEEEVLY